MADKIDRDRAKDADLDSDINLGKMDDVTLDFPEAPGPDTKPGSRSPANPKKEFAVEFMKGVGGGVWSGAKTEMAKAMPEGAAALSEASATWDDIKGLKEDISKELTPMLTTMENATRKVLPKVEKYLPKKVYDKIFKKLEDRAAEREAGNYQPQSKEQMESEQIASELGALFGEQAQAMQQTQLEQMREAQKNSTIDRALGHQRHKIQSAQLSHLYDATRSVEVFHKTQHLAYMKKSLELKYKHLFVSRDIFNLMSKSMASVEKQLEAVIQNTSLPDMAKEKARDYLRKNRTTMYGTALTDAISGIRTKIFKNIKDKVTESLSMLSMLPSIMEQGAEGWSQADEMEEMLGGKTKDRIPGWLGQAAGFFGGSPFMKRIIGKYAPYTNDINRTLGSIKSNIAVKVAEKKRKWGQEEGIKSWIASLLPDELQPSVASNDLLSKSKEATAFDVLTRQSIVEIIPGYLGKIWHSMEKMRTGDENVEEQVYNIYTRKFSTVSELKKNITSNMVGSESTRQDILNNAIATMQVGAARNNPDKDPKKMFDKYKKDINRFFYNLANHGLLLDTDEIRDFMKDGAEVSNYIARATTNFDNDPKEVLRTVFDSLFDGKTGEIDDAVVRELNVQINQFRGMDRYKSETAKATEDYGYRHIIASKLTPKQEEILRDRIRKGDKEAQKKLLAMGGLMNDDSHFNFENLLEEQVGMKYGDEVSGDKSEYQRRRLFDELRDSDMVRMSAATKADELGMNKVLSFGATTFFKLGKMFSLMGTDDYMKDEKEAEWDKKIEEAKARFEEGTASGFGLKREGQKTYEEIFGKDPETPAEKEFAKELKQKAKKGKAAKAAKAKVAAMKGKAKKTEEVIAEKPETSPREEVEETFDEAVSATFKGKKQKGVKAKRQKKSGFEKFVDDTKKKIDKKAAKLGKSIKKKGVIQTGINEVTDLAEDLKKISSDTYDKAKDKVEEVVKDFENSPDGKWLKKNLKKLKKDLKARKKQLQADFKEYAKNSETGAAIAERIEFMEKLIDKAESEGSKYFKLFKENGEMALHDPLKFANIVGDNLNIQWHKLTDDLPPIDDPSAWGNYLTGQWDTFSKWFEKQTEENKGLRAAKNWGKAGADAVDGGLKSIASFFKGTPDHIEKIKSFFGYGTAGLGSPIGGKDNVVDKQSATSNTILSKILGVMIKWSKRQSRERRAIFDAIKYSGSAVGWHARAMGLPWPYAGIDKLVKGVWKGGKWALEQGLDVYKKTYSAALKGAGTAIKGISNLAATTVKSGYKAMAGIGKWLVSEKQYVDVYVKTENGKKLLVTARQQKDPGIFYVKDGKKVERSGDISEPCVDDKGEYVITAEDLEAGLIMNNGSPIGKFGKGMLALGKGYFGLYGKAISAIGTVAGAGIKMASAFLFGTNNGPKFVDIYRKDEVGKEPLVTARQQEDPDQGVYFKETGKRVKHSAEINNTVVDRQGKVLISQDDVKHGLVDVHNKKLGSGWSGIFSDAPGMLSWLGKAAGKIAVKGAGLYVDLYKQLFGLGAGALKGVGKFTMRALGLDRFGSGAGGAFDEEAKQATLGSYNFLGLIHADVATIAAHFGKVATPADVPPLPPTGSAAEGTAQPAQKGGRKRDSKGRFVKGEAKQPSPTDDGAAGTPAATQPEEGGGFLDKLSNMFAGSASGSGAVLGTLSGKIKGSGWFNTLNDKFKDVKAQMTGTTEEQSEAPAEGKKPRRGKNGRFVKAEPEPQNLGFMDTLRNKYEDFKSKFGGDKNEAPVDEESAEKTVKETGKELIDTGKSFLDVVSEKFGAMIDDIREAVQKPEGEKPKVGDLDGDGDIDGTYADVMQKQAEKEAKEGGKRKRADARDHHKDVDWRKKKEADGSGEGTQKGLFASIKELVGNIKGVGSVFKSIGGLFGKGGKIAGVLSSIGGFMKGKSQNTGILGKISHASGSLFNRVGGFLAGAPSGAYQDAAGRWHTADGKFMKAPTSLMSKIGSGAKSAFSKAGTGLASMKNAMFGGNRMDYFNGTGKPGVMSRIGANIGGAFKGIKSGLGLGDRGDLINNYSIRDAETGGIQGLNKGAKLGERIGGGLLKAKNFVTGTETSPSLWGRAKNAGTGIADFFRGHKAGEYMDEAGRWHDASGKFIKTPNGKLSRFTKWLNKTREENTGKPGEGMLSKIGDKLGKAGKATGGALKKAGSFVADRWKNQTKMILEGTKKYGGKVLSGTKTLIKESPVGRFISNRFKNPEERQKLFGGVTDFAKKNYDRIKTFGGNAIDKLKETKLFEKLGPITKSIGGKLGELTKTLGSKLGPIASTLSDKLGGLTKMFGSKFGSMLKMFGGKLGGLVSKLGPVAKAFGGKLGGIATTLGGKSMGLAKSLGGKALNMASGIGSKIPGLATSALGKTGALGGKMLGMATKIPGIGGMLGSAGGAISGALGSAGGMLGAAGPALLAAAPYLAGAAAIAGASYLGYKALGIGGLIKGIKGNDNPLTEKEIEKGRTKLQRKIDKGMPGYDRILQEYEKAVTAQNWRRARELSGQEADGIIKSMWKESWIGKGVTGIGNLLFGNKDKEMTEEEVKKTRDKFQKMIEKGGSGAKSAEKLLSKFDDAVSEQDWKRAREIAGMEQRGLFGKLFQNSDGSVKWSRVLGAAGAALGPLGMIAGFVGGALFEKTDENKPMDEKEIKEVRERFQKMIDAGNKSAEKVLDKFDEYVTEQNWKKARKLAGKEVQSTLQRAGSVLMKGAKVAARATAALYTFGLSELALGFTGDQDSPMSDEEIKKFTDKMNYLIEKKGDKMAERKLDKFTEAVAQQNWRKAREIAKMPHKGWAARAAKAYVSFYWGDDDKPMEEAEMQKFRDSMNRKIEMGDKRAQRKLDAFEDAVGTQNWRKARTIANAPNDGINQKLAKWVGKKIANNFRFFFGGNGKPMDESELKEARAKLNDAIKDGKRNAQKRLDMFEDYVADEKWEKARALVKMPYESMTKRIGKAIGGAIGGFLFGDQKNALSPEEIDKFQKEMEQKIEDGDHNAQKKLDAFNDAVADERWERARKISKIKDGGLVGGVKNAAKGIWNFLTGNKDYEDCMKFKEKLEAKATDDDTGIVSKGVEEFEKLVRRRKYNEAMKLGKDILKYKPLELIKKHKNLESEDAKELQKRAMDLRVKLLKKITAEKSFFPSIQKIQLKNIKEQLMSNPTEWTHEFLDDIEDRMNHVTGEDIEDKPDDDTLYDGKLLVNDIEKTADKFNWITSPIKKSQLKALKNEVESDVTMWDSDTLEEWRDRLKEIAGNNAEDSTGKPRPEGDIIEKGNLLSEDIEKTKNNFTWLFSPLVKKRLSALKEEVNSDVSSWSEEKIKEWRDRLKDIAGSDAVDSSVPDDPSVEEAGKALLKDIDVTNDQFSWLGSPFVKRSLGALKEEVETSASEWNDKKMKEWRKRLKDIAGDEAVDSRSKEEQEADNAPEPEEGPAEEAASDKEISDLKKKQFEARFGGAPLTEAEEAKLAGGQKSSEVSDNVDMDIAEYVDSIGGEGEVGQRTSTKFAREVGAYVKNLCKERGMGTLETSNYVKAAKANAHAYYSSVAGDSSASDNIYTEGGEPNVEDRFASGGFFSKLKKFGKKALKYGTLPGLMYTGHKWLGDKMKGLFATKPTQDVDADGNPIEYGEAGPEAIMPIRNKPGNLLSRIGEKLGGILRGKGLLTPEGAPVDLASAHVGTPMAEPMENTMANELAKSVNKSILSAEEERPGRQDIVSDLTAAKPIEKASPLGLFDQLKAAFDSSKPKTVSTSDERKDRKTQMTYDEMASNLKKMVEINEKLFTFLQQTLGQEGGGIKISGMDVLAEVAANSGVPGASIAAKVAAPVIEDVASSGFDLRKQQA